LGMASRGTWTKPRKINPRNRSSSSDWSDNNYRKPQPNK
jgi:hypothetical protein